MHKDAVLAARMRHTAQQHRSGQRPAADAQHRPHRKTHSSRTRNTPVSPHHCSSHCHAQRRGPSRADAAQCIAAPQRSATSLTTGAKGKWGGFFTQPRTGSALCMYIVIMMKNRYCRCERGRRGTQSTGRPTELRRRRCRRHRFLKLQPFSFGPPETLASPDSASMLNMVLPLI